MTATIYVALITCLRTSHIFTHLILTVYCEIGSIIIPTFQVRKLRHAEVKEIVQSHKERKAGSFNCLRFCG